MRIYIISHHIIQEVGVKVDTKGRIEIDEHFRTNIPNIYAIGDVIKGPMLAHKASEEGLISTHMSICCYLRFQQTTNNKQNNLIFNRCCSD
jgi:pyruvate/2-oxoglutarate dehydrogenase complex dihydrolipoamide dehydrogenase (E3) component